MRLLVLAGPTAVGKSDLGLDLAERVGGEILAADSMQVYRGMDIGTAKPTPAERERVAHHLLDLVDPDAPFSAAVYAEAFHDAAAAVAARGRLPIVIGGTGLYIRASIRPFLFPDAGGREWIRQRLTAEAAEHGAAAIHARLAAVDSKAAARIHPHDLRRVIRALEVYEATGRPISAWQQEAEIPSPYDVLFICLNRDRDELYRRIEERADRMMAAGFLAEVGNLLARGYKRDLPSMLGLGYRELAAHLAGDCSLPQAVADIKRRTRNYAKRQLTWFRREPGTVWMDRTLLGREAALEEILRLMAGRWKSLSNK